ncbi:MAG: autotransporter-associated beta strand repeat-containing protein, partial [Candidatus Accumulibacter sp.]|nr:autotransporter-associated beta strand repeat-containing protein [Accumulibacter sp.]
MAILVAALFAAPSAYASCTVSSPVVGDANQYVYGSGSGNTCTSYDTSVVSGQTLNVNVAVKGYAYGAYVQMGEADVTNNTLNINNGGNVYGGMAAGGSANRGAATDNTANLYDGGTTDNITGGKSDYGAATDNVVNVYGGTVNSYVIGGSAVLGDTVATHNIVNVSGGSIGGDVYGGSGRNLTYNIVNLTGGTVNGSVYGGNNSSNIYAIASAYNTVTIGAVIFGVNTNLYGGFSTKNLGDSFTGNTLNKNNAATPVQSTRNFQFINFGYSGNANLGTLDTTPTGSTQTAVTVDTKTNTVDLNGVVTGTGGIVKIGSGTLTLSGANDYTGDT